METPKTQKQINRQNNNLSAAIQLSVDIESNFKLFGYRCVTQENFIKRTVELLQMFDKQYKKTPKSEQLDLIDEINNS